MDRHDFKVGDHVFYVLPATKAGGRPVELRLPGRVRNITPHRIVIELEKGGRERNVLPASLELVHPKGV